jgi:hypothetical protein
VDRGEEGCGAANGRWQCAALDGSGYFKAEEGEGPNEKEVEERDAPVQQTPDTPLITKEGKAPNGNCTVF